MSVIKSTSEGRRGSSNLNSTGFIMNDKKKLNQYKNIKPILSPMLKSDDPSDIYNLKEINSTLLSLGYKMENLYFLYSKYQYKSLDSAISLMSKNEGFYNHDFMDYNQGSVYYKQGLISKTNTSNS